MRIFKKMRAAPEVRNVLKVLDAAEVKHGSPGFALVREVIERSALDNPEPLVHAVRAGLSPHQAVYTQLANVAGDHLESGRFHVHRGVLDPTSATAKSLLQLHDSALDDLVSEGFISSTQAEKQKRDLRTALSQVG